MSPEQEKMLEERMKQHIEQTIKETALVVNQSTKKENSGLVDDIIKKMEAKIAESIDRAVNGKINRLTQEFREHNILVDTYIKDDNAWKDRNEPYLEGLANITGTSKIIVWIALGISTIIGAIFTIKQLFK